MLPSLNHERKILIHDAYLSARGVGANELFRLPEMETLLPPFPQRLDSLCSRGGFTPALPPAPTLRMLLLDLRGSDAPAQGTDTACHYGPVLVCRDDRMQSQRMGAPVCKDSPEALRSDPLLGIIGGTALAFVPCLLLPPTGFVSVFCPATVGTFFVLSFDAGGIRSSLPLVCSKEFARPPTSVFPKELPRTQDGRFDAKPLDKSSTLYRAYIKRP